MLDNLTSPPEWMRDALCVEYAHLRDRWWFPTQGEPTDPGKQVCARCLVRAECLDYALVHGIAHGTWGGLTMAERRRLGQVKRTA